MPDKKRLLVVVDLHVEEGPSRLTKDVPSIIALLARLSGGEQELAFRSSDGFLFGFFIKTDKPQFLQPEFVKCEGTRNRDSILAFEAGDVVAGIGFTRAATWLQRH